MSVSESSRVNAVTLLSQRMESFQHNPGTQVLFFVVSLFAYFFSGTSLDFVKWRATNLAAELDDLRDLVDYGQVSADQFNAIRKIFNGVMDQMGNQCETPSSRGIRRDLNQRMQTLALLQLGKHNSLFAFLRELDNLSEELALTKLATKLDKLEELVDGKLIGPKSIEECLDLRMTVQLMQGALNRIKSRHSGEETKSTESLSGIKFVYLSQSVGGKIEILLEKVNYIYLDHVDSLPEITVQSMDDSRLRDIGSEVVVKFAPPVKGPLSDPYFVDALTQRLINLKFDSEQNRLILETFIKEDHNVGKIEMEEDSSTKEDSPMEESEGIGTDKSDDDIDSRPYTFSEELEFMLLPVINYPELEKIYQEKEKLAEDERRAFCRSQTIGYFSSDEGKELAFDIFGSIQLEETLRAIVEEL